MTLSQLDGTTLEEIARKVDDLGWRHDGELDWSVSHELPAGGLGQSVLHPKLEGGCQQGRFGRHVKLRLPTSRATISLLQRGLPSLSQLLGVSLGVLLQ